MLALLRYAASCRLLPDLCQSLQSDSLLKEDINLSDWLSAESSDRLVTDLPILPASHNSGAVRCHPDAPIWERLAFNWAQCQSHRIEDQLRFGVRSLDIRVTPVVEEKDFVGSLIRMPCAFRSLSGIRETKYQTIRPDEPRLLVSHYFVTDTTLSEVLEEISRFLSDHPNEFVFLYIRTDHRHQSDPHWEAVSEAVSKEIGDRIFYPIKGPNELDSINKVTVGDLAGKVVLVCDKRSPIVSLGGNQRLSWHSQDIFKYADMWRIKGQADKLAFISQFLRLTRNEQCCCTALLKDEHSQATEITGLAIDGRDGGWCPLHCHQFYHRHLLNELRKSGDVRKLGLVMLDGANPNVVRNLIREMRGRSV